MAAVGSIATDSLMNDPIESEKSDIASIGFTCNAACTADAAWTIALICGGLPLRPGDDGHRRGGGGASACQRQRVANHA